MCKYWCRVAGHSSGTCDIEVVSDKFPKYAMQIKSLNLEKIWIIQNNNIVSYSFKNECLCSEEDLEKYICDPDEEGPGESTQHTLCAGWCQLKGKQSGKLYFQNGVISLMCLISRISNILKLICLSICKKYITSFFLLPI